MNDLTSEDKVVLLLNALPPDAAEAVINHLSPAHASKVRSRLLQTKESPEDVLHRASREFLDVLRIAERQPPTATAEPTAPVAPSAKLSPPPELAPPPESEPLSDPIEALKQFSPDVLLSALRSEGPATVALVVGCLDIPRATALLKLMPPEVRLEATIRSSQPSPLKPELRMRILSAVAARCREAAEQPAQLSGDQLVQRMVALVRSLGREDRLAIVGKLESSDPQLAEKVRKQLYTFDDLLRLDGRTLQSILGEVATQTLALAVKGVSEDVRAKLLTNVSRRARDTIQEELELLASAQPAQIEDAQYQIVQVLQRLDQEGKVSL